MERYNRRVIVIIVVVADLGNAAVSVDTTSIDDIGRVRIIGGELWLVEELLVLPLSEELSLLCACNRSSGVCR